MAEPLTNVCPVCMPLHRCRKPVGTIPSYEELTSDPALTVSGQANNMRTVQLSLNEPELVRLGHTRLFAAVQAVFPVNNRRDAANKAMWVKREVRDGEIGSLPQIIPADLI